MQSMYEKYKKRLKEAKTLDGVETILLQATYATNPGRQLSSHQMNRLVTLGHEVRDGLVNKNLD